MPRRRIFIYACVAFFMRFGALGAFFPYTGLWLSDVGHHSASTLGGLLALFRAVGFVSPMVLGGLADAYSCHRETFIVANIVNAMAVFAMTLAPESVVWQACMFILAAAFDGGPLLDAIVTRSMAWAGATDLAPRSRAFGAISWCVAAPIYGEVQKRFGLAALFRTYSVMLVLAMPVCFGLPIRRAYAQHSQTTKGAQRPVDGIELSTDDTGAAHGTTPATTAPSPVQKPKHFLSRVRLVLRSPTATMRFVLFFLAGMQFGIVFSFGFLYLEHELHANGAQLGLSLTAQALLEVPLFQVAAPLIRRMGKITALLTCMLAAAIRCFGYVTMRSIWAVLPFEAFHGWAFAIMYTSLALLGEEYASVGLQATVQGLGNSAQQAGSFSAVLIWSAIVSRHGLRFAFNVASVVFAVASAPLLASCTLCLRAGICSARQRIRGVREGRQGAPPMLTKIDGLRSDDLAHCSAVTEECQPAAEASNVSVTAAE